MSETAPVVPGPREARIVNRVPWLFALPLRVARYPLRLRLANAAVSVLFVHAVAAPWLGFDLRSALSALAFVSGITEGIACLGRWMQRRWDAALFEAQAWCDERDRLAALRESEAAHRAELAAFDASLLAWVETRLRELPPAPRADGYRGGLVAPGTIRADLIRPGVVSSALVDVRLFSAPRCLLCGTEGTEENRVTYSLASAECARCRAERERAMFGNRSEPPAI